MLRPDLPQWLGADSAGARPGGQSFLTRHLGFSVPSPAILERIGLGFRKAVTEFAAEGDIPVIRFAKGQRKLEVMRSHLDRLARQGRTGVAAIEVAQEFQRVFTGTTYHSGEGGSGCRGSVMPRPTAG